MGMKFNPMLYAGFQTVTRSAGNSFFGNAVDTAANLPATGVDGELRVVKDTNSLYIFDSPTNSWILVTDPLTDVRQVSFTVPESTVFSDTGLIFDVDVESFQAVINVEKDGTTKETFQLIGTRTSTVPNSTLEAIGEITSMDFDVVEDSGALKVVYKTDAPTASYKITFRVITLT